MDEYLNQFSLYLTPCYHKNLKICPLSRNKRKHAIILRADMRVASLVSSSMQMDFSYSITTTILVYVLFTV